MQKAHLAMIDALMTLAAKEIVDQVKMAAEAEQIGAGAPWENALLFWVNRVGRICLQQILLLAFFLVFHMLLLIFLNALKPLKHV